MTKLAKVFAEIRACEVCAAHLPLGPRPIIRGAPSSRLLIISQAPGTKVHVTGLSFNDRSGDRLRDWLGLDRDTFYDQTRIAIMGMGFCYPGRDAKGGDKPPRPECAPLWHPRLRPLFRKVGLVVLIGTYAQRHYLKERRKNTLTETVKAWREYLPEFLPLPHPSWRNTGWLKANPWFEAELIPRLRARVRRLVLDTNEA